MECLKIDFKSPWILKIYALRQAELRKPLALNLFDENLLSEQNEIFFAAIQDDQLLSCLQLKKVDTNTLKLRQMATKDVFKGMGIGKKLVEHSEQWAAKNGFECIELHARKIAQGFYEKQGYEKVGDEFLEVDIPHFKMQKRL